MIYYGVMWSETLMQPLFVFANIVNISREYHLELWVADKR